MEFWKNLRHEKSVFYIFLAVHLIVWTCIGLIRTVLPTDSLEGIYWGSLHDLGTPKHPPLAGWLTYLTWIIFKKDFFIYLLSQSFIILGFIYIYRLARNFVDENKAMLSVIILEGCWCYSYVTGYYGFNPDVILLFTLPAIIFYFYECMKDDKPSDWIKLGFLVGFSFLNKYQTALIILPMFLWTVMFKKKIFCQWKFYFAVLIAFVMFLPHLLWLIKFDFFPFMYYENELSASTWYNHITAPLMFVLMQLVATIGVFVIFVALKLRFKSPFKLKSKHNYKVIAFMLLFGLLPLIIHTLMGFVEGGTMRPRWGYEFWFLIGIMLFYFFPIKITKKEFDFTTKMAYAVMLIVFLSLGTLLTVEKNYRSRYPVQKVFNDVEDIFEAETKMPLKYIGGYIEWTLPLTVYGKNHPKCILDTFGYENPWIKEEDIKKSGIMIIDRHLQELDEHLKMSCPYLPKDYKYTPKQYSFTLHNALGLPRVYEIYYVVVPPIK